MKLKYIFLFSGIAFLSLTACEGQKNKESKAKLTTDLDSISYAIGASIGQNLKRDALSEINVELLGKGIKDAFNGDSSVMKASEAQAAIQSFMGNREKKKGAANIEKGKKFLEENAKKDGVKTTPDGLQYKVVKEGTGPKPVVTDKVTVHYHGTLIDGTVFDSSVDRGQPAQFGVGQVIKGWTEALQMMPVGSKYKLWIPSDLAYGERSPGGSIGPNETLIFDVELISIDKTEPIQEGK